MRQPIDVRWWFGFSALLMLVAGCAVDRKTQPLLSPRARIAVVPALYPPQAELAIYALGKNEAVMELGRQGGREGAWAGGVASTQAGILAPFLLPFTALAGYIAGGSAGRIEGRIYGLPDEQAGDVKALTAKALEQVGIPQQIARGVVERARQSGESVDLLDKAGPATSTDVLDYAGLAPEYDAVLELAIKKIVLLPLSGEPRRLALEMTMQARVVCLHEGCTAGTRELIWSGRPHPLPEWTLGYTRLLASEFEQGYDNLAQYTWEIVFPHRK